MLFLYSRKLERVEQSRGSAELKQEGYLTFHEVGSPGETESSSPPHPRSR